MKSYILKMIGQVLLFSLALSARAENDLRSYNDDFDQQFKALAELLKNPRPVRVHAVEQIFSISSDGKIVGHYDYGQDKNGSNRMSDVLRYSLFGLPTSGYVDHIDIEAINGDRDVLRVNLRFNALSCVKVATLIGKYKLFYTVIADKPARGVEQEFTLIMPNGNILIAAPPASKDEAAGRPGSDTCLETMQMVLPPKWND